MINIKNLLGLTPYTSPLDCFLETYRASHPRVSLSQCQLREEYERIFRLRDNITDSIEKNKIWDKF